MVAAIKSLFRVLWAVIRRIATLLPAPAPKSGGQLLSEIKAVNAGILTRKEIQERQLIANPQPGRLQATSYDLSLGSQYQNEDGHIHTLAEGHHLVSAIWCCLS